VLRKPFFLKRWLKVIQGNIVLFLFFGGGRQKERVKLEGMELQSLILDKN